MASSDEPTTSNSPTTPAQQDESTPARAKARVPRRRAAKAPASTPNPVADGPAADDGAPAAAKAAKAGPKNRKKADDAPVAAPRRRRAAPAVDHEVAIEDSAVVNAVLEALQESVVHEAEALAEAAAIVEDVPLGVSAALLDAASLEDEDEDEDQDAPPAAPAVANFGLLFQAPEPTVAPRRRRATAPVQAPTAAEPDDDLGISVADEGTGADASAQDREGRDAGPAETESIRARRRRGGRGRRVRVGDEIVDTDAEAAESAPLERPDDNEGDPAEDSASTRRRRRRRRTGTGTGESDDPPGTVTKVREPRRERDEPTAVKGSTRLEAKKQRRREGRESGRRRTIITEAEFLARRESVDRVMVVRGLADRTQIGVLEDDVLVEHYVSRETTTSMAGNVYLGRVQNVLPSMEAAFVDIGKGRNAVLYAGEVNWDAAGLDGGRAKRIENALSSGDTVLVQVTKDPMGHKGARLTSQISLPGRFLVYVPEGSMTGISRKLPDTERARLKAILKEIVPDSAGVIVRTAAEGASEEELRADVERLTASWAKIQEKAAAATSKKSGGGAPRLLHGEPDLTVRVIRDIFTEDFTTLIVSGEQAWREVSDYVEDVAPDLAPRVTRWTSEQDVFSAHRIDEQLAKAMDRKVWLPSGGSLVIDRTEAMTVVDVNTGRFVGSGGNLEETVTKNNIEAAEEIVRQLRLRDLGGIIVIDFIDMVLESNRDLVVRRLLECLGRDRTKHQVAEVTSLGLVQMTRKRVGSGLLEVFSEACSSCGGRGIVVHTEPVASSGSTEQPSNAADSAGPGGPGTGSRVSRRPARTERSERTRPEPVRAEPETRRPSTGPTAAQIAAAAHAAALKHTSAPEDDDLAAVTPGEEFDEPLTNAPAIPAPFTASESDAFVADLAGSVIITDVFPDPADAPMLPDAPAQPDKSVPAAAAVGATPPAQGRRRRGRVVAPAGPPRHSSETDPGTEPPVD